MILSIRTLKFIKQKKNLSYLYSYPSNYLQTFLICKFHLGIKTIFRKSSVSILFNICKAVTFHPICIFIFIPKICEYFVIFCFHFLCLHIHSLNVRLISQSSLPLSSSSSDIILHSFRNGKTISLQSLSLSPLSIASSRFLLILVEIISLGSLSLSILRYRLKLLK